ncbi:MAG: iron-containing alcohol dehydrogenase [Desulfobacterales bacterium]|jgi:alcohol dehydrogenase class IV
MTGQYEFHLTTRIIYSMNSSIKIGEIANSFGKKKYQLITDAGIAGAGILDCLLAPLKSAGIDTVLFDKVEVNPTVQTVDKACEHYNNKGCEGVIAVGGGSPMDTGKSVGILATNPGSASDYLGPDNWGKIKNPSVPVICVPTTAGTAAEITDVAVLSDPERKVKLGIFSPYIVPAVAILDPLLTISLPPEPTRDSGLDALCHAVESYISINSWCASEALTLKAIELAGRHLRTAVHNGQNVEARDGMLMASLLAGMGFLNTKLCLVHAITGPIGGLYNCPHGAINAIVLPHAMRFMLPGAVSKYANIAIALGEDVGGLSERAAAEKAVEAVVQLSKDVGLPKGLSVYGIKEEDLEKVSEMVAANFQNALSPRKASPEEILEIFRTAL